MAHPYVEIEAKTRYVPVSDGEVYEYCGQTIMRDPGQPSEPKYIASREDPELAGEERRRQYWPFFEKPVIRQP